MAWDWVAIVTPAAAGLVGVGLGSALQFLAQRAQRSHERQEARRSERLIAYTAYINHLRTIALDLREGLVAFSDEEWRAAFDRFLRQAAELRTALALQASDAVIAAVDEDGDAAEDAFLKALREVAPAMRERIDAEDVATVDELAEIVRTELLKQWGKTLKPFVEKLMSVMRKDLARP